MAPTWTSPTRPAVFFWYLFIAAKIPRAAGEKLLKTPQALGLTSKQLSSFFTRCFWDPRLFSPGNQILLEIFLSDITIHRTLALDIMFISDLYMSTWPIKFIEGLESFSLFINLPYGPPLAVGKKGAELGRKGVPTWRERMIRSMRLPLLSFSPLFPSLGISGTAEQRGYTWGHESWPLWAGQINVLSLSFIIC